MFMKKTAIFFIMNIKPEKTYRITQTEATEYNPQFSFQKKKLSTPAIIICLHGILNTGETRQLTNIVNGTDENKKEKLTPENQWLKNEQVQYLEVLRKRLNEKKTCT